MIIQRGLVGRASWIPGTYATDIMIAAYSAYLQGSNIHTDQRVIYEYENVLHVSFGRQRGHTTSIVRFLRDIRPDLDHAVIAGNRSMLDEFQRNYPNGGGTYLTVSSLGFLRGRLAPDVIFLDLGFRQFADSMGQLLQTISPYTAHGTKIISVMSDGLDTEKWVHPVDIEIEANAELLSSLKCVDYDIARSQLKTSGQ